MFVARVSRNLPALGLAIIAPLVFFAAAQALPAQSAAPVVFDATHIHEPVNLGGTWLVHAGDDLAYARPDFDDSRWTPFDTGSSLVTLYGRQQPPVIWYRLRVKVDPADTGLGLSENNLSDAFEIYVNGQRLIANGQVKPFRPSTFAARLRAPIPNRLVASGELMIALRVHISPTQWNGQGPGYFPSNLTLGQFDTLYRDDWLAAIGQNLDDWVYRLLMLGVGLIALVLWWAQRSQKEYLWIVAASVLMLCDSPLPVISPFINVPEHWVIFQNLFHLASPFVTGSLYFSFIRYRVGWAWRGFFLFAGVTNVLASLQGVIFTVPLTFQVFINLPYIVLLSIFIPVVLAIHWRRGNREAGILLIPSVLFSLYIYLLIAVTFLFQIPASRQSAIRLSNSINSFPVGPFSVSLAELSEILSTLALGVIILLRSSRTGRRQALLESELVAAQQIQQLLVPEQVGAIPGFRVDSIYLPAQQVGGDFFQVLPSGEGGLLVIVGDVAGKGLPAAMLVSVLVGAIRATAEFTHDPAKLLAGLNDRLVGRAGGALTTAAAALITADGLVTIANAGHLPPYLDGREVALPGALPLGVVAGVAYTIAEFALEPGSCLTFCSDGVVEAQNAQGELFGFERAQEKSTHSAADLAEAARKFGQQDDITVVTIEWAGATVAAA
ncbi:MAG TPA: SpoIIE family protein phosphatase [Terracidiphilus sp.]|nr:SpoIIE family protein phosphatase [Terracidiphilus sp.]